MTRPQAPTRETFVARFASTSEAMSFEEHVLSAGREYLSPAEIAVLDGAEPTAEYWAAMIDALEQSEALDATNRYNSGAEESCAQ